MMKYKEKSFQSTGMELGTPFVRQYGILNNKWGAVHSGAGDFPV